MQFRVMTLNLEQDHKRWGERHPLISTEIAGLKPDVIAPDADRAYCLHPTRT